MTTNVDANVRWLLEQEARALLTRLGRVKPFALQETMLPAAALSPAALIAIEHLLVSGRYELRGEVHDYLHWLRGAGKTATAEQLQRRFTRVRMRFNNALSQFDSFSEVITQRSESETGVWLSGLDVFAADALTLPGDYYDAPQVICYLARGPGAAIRRARTRIPGGALSPVALVRVPRERMVGHSIASSLVHEVGHQGAALLNLVPSLRAALQQRSAHASAGEKPAWAAWERWISEIVADFWSVGKLGIGSTLGLMGVVSLPKWYVFRLNADDPHPIPWIRVVLSCAVGDALYPDPQWRKLATSWEAMYPVAGLDAERSRLFGQLRASMPEFVQLMAGHRPSTLHGRSLAEVMPLSERAPARLAELYRIWTRDRAALREAPPSLAFASLGQGRAIGELDPERESRIVGNLLTFWALRSTLDITEVCAVSQTAKRRAARTSPALVPAN